MTSERLRKSPSGPSVVLEDIPPGDTPGDLIYWDGTDWMPLAPPSEGALLGFSAGAPYWLEGNAGDLIYNSGSAWSLLTAGVGKENSLLGVSSGLPVWIPPSSTEGAELLALSGVPTWRATQPRSSVYEVGSYPGMYATIHDAIAAVNLNPPGADSRADILVYPGYYLSTTAYQVPANTRIVGFGNTTQLQNDTTTLFDIVGDRVYFSNFLIEGSSNSALYAFTCNDHTGIIIDTVEMLNRGGTARQKFLNQVGATWTILCIKNCTVDYRGTSGYAVNLQNTSGAARLVDTWIMNCFFDAFGLTTFGGSFQVAKLTDLRFWYNVIRGTNNGPNFNTGVRINNGGVAGINVEFAHCTMTGVNAGSGGVAIFGEANTNYICDNCIALGALTSGTRTLRNTTVV